MRFGPFRLSRQRAARSLAGLVAAFLLAGNVLAAAGLCVVRAPANSHPMAQQAAPDAAAQPCTQHVADELGSGPTGSSHHCPSDDPSAQTRTVDVPAAQLMVALTAAVLSWADPALQPLSVVVKDLPSEPQPLYARLQRLRL